MTTITSMKFKLQPIIPLTLPRWNGALMRDCFIDQMPSSVAREATPADGRLPYTVSNLLPMERKREPYITLQPEQVYHWQVTTLHDVLSDWAVDWANSMIGQTLTLSEGAYLKVETVSQTSSTDDALAQQHTLNIDSSGRIELDLLSPTAFKHFGMITSLPTPRLIFRGLVETWNRFNTNVQFHPDVDKFADECMSISHHRLNSITVTIPETNYPSIVGGIGFLRMVIRNPDRYWRGIIHALAVYGEYAGVGVRTAVGMGQIRIRHN